MAFTNNYAGYCHVCNNRVEAHAGLTEKIGLKWAAFHHACFTQYTAAQQPKPDAPPSGGPQAPHSPPVGDPPNLDLIIRLLRLTASENDGEALNAARMANRQLTKFGGDWEALLRGKVTIVEDPFNSIARPDTQQRKPPPPPPPQPRQTANYGAAPPKPSWSPPPPPKPAPQPTSNPYGTAQGAKKAPRAKKPSLDELLRGL